MHIFFQHIHIIAPTLTLIGDVMIAIVVLNVHTRVAEEHKIDNAVIRYMRRERTYVIIGIILILTGYALKVVV